MADLSSREHTDIVGLVRGPGRVLLLLVVDAAGDGKLLRQRPHQLECVALGNDLGGRLPDVGLTGWALGELERIPHCWLQWRRNKRACFYHSLSLIKMKMKMNTNEHTFQNDVLYGTL